MYKVTIDTYCVSMDFEFDDGLDAIAFLDTATNKIKQCRSFDDPCEYSVTMKKVPEGGNPSTAQKNKQGNDITPMR